MAVSPSPEARRGSSAERFRFLRELGSCAVPTWAALETFAERRSQLVVVERARPGSIEDPSIADWIRGARRLATLEHPNMGRVRDIVNANDEVVIVSDFIDGVRWKDLATCAQPPPLEVAIRILVDVLSGLGALRNLRDAERRPLKLVHGALTPDCVIVGQDGVTRVVAASRARTIASRPTDAGSAYFAPEVLLEDDSADPRADVYSVGVMLWEALSGRPLFADMQASAIVTNLLSGRVPAATVPAAVAWAAPLAEAVSRALSVDPEKRFASASAMAAELRRVTATRLPAPVRLAAMVRTVFGDSIRTRREELERGELRAGAVSRVDSVPSGVDVPISADGRLSTAPTPVPPALTAITERPPPWPAPAPILAPPAPPAPRVPAPVGPAPLPMPQPARAAFPGPAAPRPVASVTPTSASPSPTVVSQPEIDAPTLPPVAASPALPVWPMAAASLAETEPVTLPPMPFVPKPEPVTVPPEPSAPVPVRRSSKTPLVAAVAASLLVALAGLAWWAGSRTPDSKEGVTAASATATASATPTATPTPTATLAPLDPVPEPPPSAEPAVSTAAPVTTAPPARPHVVAKPRYDPEGI